MYEAANAFSNEWKIKHFLRPKSKFQISRTMTCSKTLLGFWSLEFDPWNLEFET